ncbi:MAG: peptidase M15A [Hyphomicrobiaceae bacterium]|nr:MAG: peptidase M15A [Hyphomicrobiaceae bacterium]
MQLTKNFTLAEMVRSATAERKEYREQFDPPEDIKENLIELCTHILQPLRNIVGQPIFVNSGYRCPRLNKDIGGKKNSQHLTGQAADLQATGEMSNTFLYRAILDNKLPFDQLIWEYGDDTEPEWVHVSYSSRNRREVFRV